MYLCSEKWKQMESEIKRERVNSNRPIESSQRMAIVYGIGDFGGRIKNCNFNASTNFNVDQNLKLMRKTFGQDLATNVDWKL